MTTVNYAVTGGAVNPADAADAADAADFGGTLPSGLVTFNAITSGDQPILKAVVGLTGVLFVLALTINDMLYSLVDPRVAKP